MSLIAYRLNEVSEGLWESSIIFNFLSQINPSYLIFPIRFHVFNSITDRQNDRVSCRLEDSDFFKYQLKKQKVPKNFSGYLRKRLSQKTFQKNIGKHIRVALLEKELVWITLQSRIPSLTASYKFIPSLSRGNKWLKLNKKILLFIKSNEKITNRNRFKDLHWSYQTTLIWPNERKPTLYWNLVQDSIKPIR